MTKPSYEEPDYFALCAEHGALREKNSLPYATCVRCLLAASEQKRYAAEAENLRVRGLLQRVNVLSSRLWSMAQGMDEGGDVEELALQLETLAEQAESADIGKLDTADKSGSREPEKLNNAQTITGETGI